MNILMVGPPENNSTDGVIIKGIKYLLDRNFEYAYMYIELKDTTTQEPDEFYPKIKFDLIVVSGTPWLWDSFQKSVKFQNLKVVFAAHPEAKRLFMGIGSCLYLKDVYLDILERPEEQSAMHEIYDGATVIVRDSLAYSKLKKAGIRAHSLPCPAYYCYGEEVASNYKSKNILIAQDPTKSISAGDWQDLNKLEWYSQTMRDYQSKYNATVFCANVADIDFIVKNGLPYPLLLSNADQTLQLMREAAIVMSGRVHCAVPAIVQGADVTFLPLDTRSYVVTEFPEDTNFKAYLPQYDRILKDIFVRRVGTESQRTYVEFVSNGFFAKYMSGKGLDIGYAGYTEGVSPILATAIGVDINYPGYDGNVLPFETESQDYVYSSHCLEHISDWRMAISEWHRVLKNGGHMVVIVPHQYLYEKRRLLPSKWNEDHKRFYTPSTLLFQIESALLPNSVRVRLLEDGDRGFDYRIDPNRHSTGQYEILLVVQKIQQPIWNLE